MVEQDLVVCRALVAVFSNPFLAENLAFRGGTALHKLYLSPQPRYSEDIDLVQINPGPIRAIMDHLRDALAFLGDPKTKSTPMSNKLLFRFESEMAPVEPLKLKVEINCREHFHVLPWCRLPFFMDKSLVQRRMPSHHVRAGRAVRHQVARALPTQEGARPFRPSLRPQSGGNKRGTHTAMFLPLHGCFRREHSHPQGILPQHAGKDGRPRFHCRYRPDSPAFHFVQPC